MTTDFSDQHKALKYLEFSLSDEGEKQHDLIWQNLEPILPIDRHLRVLDAGCGSGWLAAKLTARFETVVGFDSSQILLDYAKHHSSAEFVQADLSQKLPFENGQFDLVVASLLMHDLKDLPHGFNELARVLKPNGIFLMVSLNPYYAHPVGSWKRNLWEKITRTMPKIKLASYGGWKLRSNRLFKWKIFESYFYTLPELLNAAIKSGLKLEFMEDLVAKGSDKLDIGHRSRHWPIFIVSKFKLVN